MRQLCFLILIIAFNSFPVIAEKALGFSDAAYMAIENSEELRNEYIAKALREGAWIWGIRNFLPKLSITASEDDRLSTISADSFLKNYSVNIEQLLWDGGRLSLSRKMERAELDLAGSKLKQMASDLGESAVSAYRDVLQGRIIFEIQEKTLESLEEQRRILEREAELGLVRQSDLLEAEITVALAELELISLAMDLEQVEDSLADKLGLEELPVLSERIDTERSPKLPIPAKVQALALSRNLELAELRLSVAIRQAEARTAALSWIPSLHLTGSFGLSGSRYPLSQHSWSVGLSVSFSAPWVSGSLSATRGGDPPYDSNARLQQTLTPVPDPASIYSVRSAELALNYERSRYETAVKELNKAVEQRVKRCSLLDKKRVLAMEALNLEGEKYRLAELRLALGEITRLELMEARLDYAKRESALVEAAAALLQAERELERLFDLAPGELASFVSLFADAEANTNGMEGI